MEALEKKIIGHWIEVKEILRDIHAILDYFSLPPRQIDTIGRELAAAVELGILEYKRDQANPIYRKLGEARYKSLAHEVITDLQTRARGLLFITVLQRLITAGLVKIEAESPSEKISAEQIEINLILKDILARIKHNPEFSKKTAVKNILVQFSIYQNERETLKKLSPNIKSKSDTFYQNFKATFEKIFASIRKNYQEILIEDRNHFKKRHILQGLQDKPLTTLLFNQVKEECRLLATLEYVSEERYKTREILIKLAEDQFILFDLFENESQLYHNYCEQNRDKTVAAICNSFNKEILALFHRHLNG